VPGIALGHVVDLTLAIRPNTLVPREHCNCGLNSALQELARSQGRSVHIGRFGYRTSTSVRLNARRKFCSIFCAITKLSGFILWAI
jgi:hypothetical protein